VSKNVEFFGAVEFFLSKPPRNIPLFCSALFAFGKTHVILSKYCHNQCGGVGISRTIALTMPKKATKGAEQTAHTRGKVSVLHELSTDGQEQSSAPKSSSTGKMAEAWIRYIRSKRGMSLGKKRRIREKNICYLCDGYKPTVAVIGDSWKRFLIEPVNPDENKYLILPAGVPMLKDVIQVACQHAHVPISCRTFVLPGIELAVKIVQKRDREKSFFDAFGEIADKSGKVFPYRTTTDRWTITKTSEIYRAMNYPEVPEYKNDLNDINECDYYVVFDDLKTDKNAQQNLVQKQFEEIQQTLLNAHAPILRYTVSFGATSIDDCTFSKLFDGDSAKAIRNKTILFLRAEYLNTYGIGIPTELGHMTIFLLTIALKELFQQSIKKMK